jgi:ribosomal protein L16 Arg81 hydroxylase
VTGSHKDNAWLFKELPVFAHNESLFIVNDSYDRMIDCRFGMRAVTAEPHFDGERNTIALVQGLRRWILASPDNCPYMYLASYQEASARHSTMDLSHIDHEEYPEFKYARGLEVILKAGDVLYNPTYWLHYVISLNVNYQCTSFSGKSQHDEYQKYISACGF